MTPVLVPLRTLGWWNEELKFHLFKFASTENEVSWCDFVTETLSDLSNTERRLLAACLQNVGEVHKHALCCLWTQIHICTRSFNWAGRGLKHQVESACFSELTALHALRAIARLNVIFTETSFTYSAINQWVRKVGQVTRSFKDLWWSQNCCVNQHNVISLLHHGAHPSVFYIAQHQRAQWAVVIRGSEASVDFGTGVYKPSAFTQIDNLFKVFSGHRYLAYKWRSNTPRLRNFRSR